MTTATLITGATSGLGLEFSKGFASLGHNLVIVARDENKLNSLKLDLEKKYGIIVDYIAKDLSEENSAKEIFDYTKNKDIFINYLINNAGFGDYGPFPRADLQKQNEMVKVNILALMNLTHYYVQDMIKYRNGGILNVASVASFEAGPLMSVYYSTKAFVLSFTQALKEELTGTGIKVTALCPGPTKTGFKKAANLERSGLFKNLHNSSATFVVKSGIKALMKNKAIEIPGITNKLAIIGSKFAPRKLTNRVVYHIQK